ncbi:MAG TPA: trigger factor [Beijerinckiaceae bacterium]|nr:trigger factor [Beijerinckiaceae bacterium]
MQLTQTQSDGLKRQFQVTVPASELESRLNAEIEQLKTKVRINGFRPGKVPAGHLKRLYGKSVMADVVQNAVTEANRRIVEENDLKLAMEPQIDFPEDKELVDRMFDGKADLSFGVHVEVLPRIEVQDHSDIAVTRQVVAIEDKEVDAALERMASQNRSFNDKGNKKAETGDRVTIDFVGTLDGVAFDGGSSEDADLVLGSGSFIPGFEDQLVGAKAGDRKTVTVTFPEGYQAAHLAGKPAEFAVTVKAVAAPGDLVIDDELARKFGMEDLGKLKDAIRRSLGEELNEIARSKTKRQLLDALDAKYAFDLPPTLVEQEFNTVWSQVQQDMQARKTSFDAEGTTEDEARAEYRRIAERRVRLGLVLAELGSRAKVEVTDEEVTQALVTRARQFPGREKQVWEFYQKNPQALAEVRAPIFEEKVIDTLLAAVTVTDQSVTREELLKDDEDEDKPAKSAGKSAEKSKKAAAKAEAGEAAEKPKKAPAKKKVEKSES